MLLFSLAKPTLFRLGLLLFCAAPIVLAKPAKKPFSITLQPMPENMDLMSGATPLIEEAFAVEPNEQLSIQLPLADIHIKSVNSTKAKVAVHLQATDRTKAKQMFDALQYKIHKLGRTVALHSKASSKTLAQWDTEAWGDAIVDVVIEVPRTFDVSVEVIQGNIEVINMEGNINLHTAAGNIETANLRGGRVTMETEAGDIAVGNIEGQIKLYTKAGNIQMGNVHAKGHLDIVSEGGNIAAKELSADYISILTQAGSVRVEQVKGATSVKTHAGDIQIDEMYGKLEAEALAGDVEVKLYQEDMDTGIQPSPQSPLPTPNPSEGIPFEYT